MAVPPQDEAYCAIAAKAVAAQAETAAALAAMAATLTQMQSRLIALEKILKVYLLIVVGWGINEWPGIFHHPHWAFFEGVVAGMLTAFSMLCILVLRYPLQMLPVLFWEMLWKMLWLGIVALPRWWVGQIDEAIVPNIFACSFVVLYSLGIPWRHVYAHYVTKSGDRWRAVDGGSADIVTRYKSFVTIAARISNRPCSHSTPHSARINCK